MNEKCFALRSNGECGALSANQCVGPRQCSFYKPNWMHHRDRDRSYAKLRTLPDEMQQQIADKYHHGHMPWRGEIE